MELLYAGFAVFLLLNLLLGLVRVARGPTRADRLVAAQLFGTTGVAFLLSVGFATGTAALRDVAIVFAVLAPVNAIVFSRSLHATHARRSARGGGLRSASDG